MINILRQQRTKNQQVEFYPEENMSTSSTKQGNIGV